MFSSGGTANNVASWIKEKGAKYVEGWFSHIVTAKEQIKKALKADSIDKIVALNTVIQDLLAAELYKAHENFLTDRIA